jgi:glycosyltransferase involved in cell wall biosynthesis
VPPADEKALANGIKKLLDDPEKAKQMGQQGKEYCRQYSLEAMIAKLDDLYSGLITN